MKLFLSSPQAGLNGASEHATIQWFSLATQFSCSGVNVSGEISLQLTRWYVHVSCKAWDGPWMSWIPRKHWETLSSLRLSMNWRHHQQQPLLAMKMLWYCVLVLTRRLSGSWIFAVICLSQCLYGNCSLVVDCFHRASSSTMHSFGTLSCRRTISLEVTFCFTHRFAQAGKPSGLAYLSVFSEWDQRDIVRPFRIVLLFCSMLWFVCFAALLSRLFSRFYSQAAQMPSCAPQWLTKRQGRSDPRRICKNGARIAKCLNTILHSLDILIHFANFECVCSFFVEN